MKINLVFVLLAVLVLLGSPWACSGGGKGGSSSGSEIVNADKPGEELDINDVLVKGKTNIVDFYSEYCPPCVAISPLLSKLNKKRDDLVVIKIDINRPGFKPIDWKSPVALQYELKSIPHFKIYDTDGNKLMEGRQAYQKVLQYLREEKIEN